MYDPTIRLADDDARAILAALVEGRLFYAGSLCTECGDMDPGGRCDAFSAHPVIPMYAVGRTPIPFDGDAA